jgi:hypothetical protein
MQILLMSLLCMTDVSQASTSGEQDFHFFGKTGDTIWITEDIGGEYRLSILHQCIVSGDEVVHGVSTAKKYAQWQPLTKLTQMLDRNQVVAIGLKQDGSYGHAELNWTVSAPAEDPNFAADFGRHIEAGGSNARTWAQANPSRVLQVPQFENAQAQMLYSYGRGLYVNYRIDWACWLPQSRLLVLFTYQPLKAVGMDTMHGFMLLRIPEEQ